MRTFVGLRLPDEVREQLEGLQARLKAGRLVRPENLHLTLAFLGDQKVEILEDLDAELGAIRVPPFKLTLAGLDSFGGDRPRVLFVGAEKSPALIGLHRRIRSAARQAGISLPRERFHPHVTLSRFQAHESSEASASLTWALRVHAAFALPAFTISEFTLFRSHLTADSPVYEVLRDYPLHHDGLIHWNGEAPASF